MSNLFNYIVKQFFYSLSVLVGVIVMLFFIFNILPGDPARMMLGQRANAASIQLINKQLGLDLPAHEQFFFLLNDLSFVSIHNIKDEQSFYHLSQAKYAPFKVLANFSDKAIVLKYPYLRQSYQNQQKVSAIIAEKFTNTLVLAVLAIALASFLGIAMGVFAALKNNSWIDKLIILLSTFGMSAPSFFVAMVFAWLFAYVLHTYTGLNLTGSLYLIDDFGEGKTLQLQNLILPTITLGIRPLSVITQLTKTSMLEVLATDYIRTAKAKGLAHNSVILKHALINALNPVITSISGWFAGMLSGAIFIEIIFNYDGLGKTLLDAIENYDFPLVMGIIMTIAIAYTLIHITTDILYKLIDKRVK